MRSSQKIILFALLALASLSLLACQNRTQQAHKPTTIPLEFRIGVAWFTQPDSTRELIIGQLPDHQGRINPSLLPDLDMTFARTLAQESSRQYVSLTRPDTPLSMHFQETGSPQGANIWMQVAKKADLDMLIVPQIINWHEREGSQAGVARAASIKVEFYLFDVARNRLLKRSVFEEEQVGLSDNLLTMGKFFSRKGRWVSASELTQEGMIKAIREFGL